MASTEAVARPTRIEPIGVDQSEAVWPLSIEAGWNQNSVDWRYMLDSGHAFGVRSANGGWDASALVLPLGGKLAWISMVLVAERRRREGLGTALLKKCIDVVRASGAVAGLDATDQGRPIYLPMGFRDLYRISRWHLDPAATAPAEPPHGIALRPLTAQDVPAIAGYDSRLSGMERRSLLGHLAQRQPKLAWVAETAAGKPSGFAMGREGRVASYIGPVIADSEAVAVALIARAAASVPPPFILDVPERHSALRSWLVHQRAATPRAYMRMTLGRASLLDDPSHVFALAGPELG